MFCRCCGYDNNGRDSGRCGNCGFDLSKQNLSITEKRSALQSKLEKPASFRERTEFRTPPPRGHAPVIGIVIALMGLAAAFVITHSFERSEYTPALPQRDRFEELVPEIQVDSLALLIGSDIVYVLDDSATVALPRANVDMTAIPEGSTVSFLARWSTPLRPSATFVLQKISQREFNVLSIDRLCVWTDSTETGFISAPIIRLRQSLVDSVPGPVLVKLYFTPEMMRGRVEEFNIQIDRAITTDEFTDGQLTDLLESVAGRLARQEYADRGVQVAVLFDYNAYDLGDAVEIMRRLAPVTIDSLGYEGFSLSVFALTD
ncbi:MAG: hypothetical protein JXA64_01895 [Candidatus Fermentibacteraceae bacterium]|nr:hypothetical protein [Candidatus Fermentibacteraceae bacterium]MBN2607839.1 hypothetical protein [Candidatus Fermentibacteraceae bacterium]